MPIREGEKFLKNFLADTEEEADKLYKNYKRLISHLAWQFSVRSGVDAEDLFEEGLIGLARAKRDFVPEKSKTKNKAKAFHIFAVYMIRNALREGVYVYETPVPVPAYLKESNYYYTKMREALENVGIPYEDMMSMMEEPKTRAEDFGIEKPHSITVNKFKDKLHRRAKANNMSYGDLLNKAISIPRRKFMDIYQPEFSEAFETFDDERLDKQAALERVKEVLSQEEYDVLVRFSTEKGLKVEDLADEYGVTSGRISQIISGARETLNRRRKYIMDGDSPIRRKRVST
jgi:RNA polymerase sigma factor (sigma-70 family)